MDSKDFEEFLKQHIQVKKDKRKNSRRPDPDEEPIEITRGNQTFMVTEEHNPTMPIENFEVIKKPQPCDSCSQTVTDRVVELKQYTFPFKHWRRRCLACSRFFNPETKKFDLNNMAAINFWNKQLRNSITEPVFKLPTK